MRKLVLLAGLLALAGCDTHDAKEARKMQAKPVNCVDAKQDIAALNKEKASVAQRVVAGSRFVIPVAVVVNIFQEGSGSPAVKERSSVVSGDYNKALEAKIAEIKSACNV